ncbi:MAG TPA: Lsr2 family protein [Sporichthyaceae bacterium]|jgi:hypothetical protein|nr:Lsr2 family protein [Sporichthyaceae bacterium]
MASRTVTVFEDDLGGGKAVETVGFGLDGVSYEIDLSQKNAAKLRSTLQRYTTAGRRLGGRSTRARATTPARVDGEQMAAIRAWARDNGWQVSDRGRIPAAIMETYHSAG